MKYFFKIVLVSILVLACNKDNSSNNPILEEEIKVIAQRIEFSNTNIIPDGLRILTMDGTNQIESVNQFIPKPQKGNGLELLIDSEGNIIFLKRDYSNFITEKINAESSILFLTTFNTSFGALPVHAQSTVIEAILSHPLFSEIINFIDQQSLINLFDEYILSRIGEIIADVYNIDLLIGNDDFPVANIEYYNNDTNVTISNPTNNFIAFSIHLEGLTGNIFTIEPNNSATFSFQDVNTNYYINIMSGEKVATDLYGNLELEEIEAFNSDMNAFMHDWYAFVLGPIDEEDCLIQIYNGIFETVDFAADLSGTEGPLEAFYNALGFFYTQFSGVINSSNSCVSDLGIDSIVEVLEYFEEIFDALEGSNYLAEIAVTIQDYSIYQNQLEICLISDGIGVFECTPNNVEPAFNPYPSNGAIEVETSGLLSFSAGENTPNDATFELYFDTNSTPSTLYTLEANTNSFNYTDLQGATEYFWKVITVNSSDEILAESPVWSFTTDDINVVTDFDGNIYNVIQIGDQFWLKENLKTTRYNNGDYISTGLSDTEIYNTTEGAFVVFDDDLYGKLYNWFAVTDSRNICPDGFHTPSDSEWATLRNFLEPSAGGKLKSISNLWNSPNLGANDSSGFSGLPGGQYRYFPNGFYDQNSEGIFWTSTESSTSGAKHYALRSDTDNVHVANDQIKVALRSCRCIKD